MPMVRIEHRVHAFDAWKAAFDRDPAGRRKMGVQSYRILRPVDDPAYVMIDLDFGTVDEAQEFLVVMNNVWQSPQATSALHGSPQARIVDVLEDVTL